VKTQPERKRPQEQRTRAGGCVECQGHSQTEGGWGPEEKGKLVSGYTTEPWVLELIGDNATAVHASDGSVITVLYFRNPDEDRCNARRIVACVNACAGIATKVLEELNSRSPVGHGGISYSFASYLKEKMEQIHESATQAVT